jgi:hypothetical protein
VHSRKKSLQRSASHEVLNTHRQQEDGRCDKLRDDNHLPAASSDHLYALLTSIKDYAEDWDSVLTDDEYIKLKQASGGCKVVKELQDKIDNADQTVQSPEAPQGGAQPKQATEDARFRRRRWVLLTRSCWQWTARWTWSEVHATAAASIAEAQDGARSAKQAMRTTSTGTGLQPYLPR